MSWPIPDLVELVPEPRARDRERAVHVASVLLHMVAGLTVTAAAALLLLRSARLQSAVIVQGGLTLVGALLLLLPLLLVGVVTDRVAGRVGAGGMRVLFLLYAIAVGVALGTVLLA